MPHSQIPGVKTWIPLEATIQPATPCVLYKEMRRCAPGCGLNLCDFCLGLIELAWMNGFVEDIVPESTSKPSSFIPGFEVKGSPSEVKMKGVQDIAVGLGMQRVCGRAGGRARGQKGEREMTDRISGCWEALSRPDPCLGNREFSLFSRL